MADWCNDCAWPEACAARMECERRRLGEVRGTALPEEAPTLERVAARLRLSEFAVLLGVELKPWQLAFLDALSAKVASRRGAA